VTTGELIDVAGQVLLGEVGAGPDVPTIEHRPVALDPVYVRLAPNVTL
jgi:hypothetical protein